MSYGVSGRRPPRIPAPPSLTQLPCPILLLHAVSQAVSHRVCPQPPAGSGDRAWERTFPRSILQFLGLVQRSFPQDPAWRTPDFLQTLAIITFPLEAQKVGLALF